MSYLLSYKRLINRFHKWLQCLTQAIDKLGGDTQISLPKAYNRESYVQIVKFFVGLETARLHQNSKELCNNST